MKSWPVRSIPILYFHRVNEVDPCHLAISPRDFEELLLFLTQRKYQTLAPEELVEALSTGHSPVPNPVVLTFDDGYRDNFLFGFPLLRKYRMKALVFLITSVLPDTHSERLSARVLPFTEANIRARLPDPDFSQFMSWAELREAEKTGTLFGLSHSHSHGQIFADGQIQGIFSHRSPHWGILTLPGFRAPDTNFFTPRRCSALIRPAFFIDSDHHRELNERYLREGQTEKKALKKLVENGESWLRGRFESPAGYLARIRHEFKISKERVEDRLDRPCDHFCWPWGQESIEARAEALKAGYRALHLVGPGPNANRSHLVALKRYQVRRFSPLALSLALAVRKNVGLSRLYARIRGLL